MSDGEGKQASGRKVSRKAKRQRRERGRLHLSQAASGIWYIRGTVANTQVYQSTGVHSEDHAKRIRDDLERKLLDERVYGKKLTVSFAEALDRYELEHPSNSLTRYLPRLREVFGGTLLREIKAGHIRSAAMDEYPDCKNTTRNTCFVNPMVTVLSYAAKLEMCERPNVERFKDDSAKIEGAPPEWIEMALTTACRPDTEEFKVQTFVALLTTTGCRAIDATRLRVRNLNLDRGTALLSKMKNDESGLLHMTGAMVAMLRKLTEGMEGHERVFGWGRDADEAAGTRAANSALYRFAAARSMDQMSTHRIGRHAFAERWLADGGTIKDLKEAGRWKDLRVVDKRYGHLEQSRINNEVKDKAAALLRPKLKVVGGGG